ncbi:MAG: PEFG-CTERM sorting domain-containing protein [Nitrosotalea sp.]
MNVTVTIPADHANNVKLTPSIYATEAGATGGSTVLNIRVEKMLTIDIGNPPVETPVQQSTAPVLSQNSSAQVQQPSTQSPGSTTIVAGNSTVPEFGAIAGLVFTIAIMSIIVVSARTGLKVARKH